MRTTIEPDRHFIRRYGDLIQTLVQHRVALGMSQLELDNRAGLQEGYAGKVEA